LTGFKDVRALDELDAALKQSTAKNKLVWISKIPAVALSGCFDRAVPADKAQRKDPFDGRPSREEALEANLREDYGVDVRDCGPLLAEMRRVKTTEEIDALRRANESGAQAMMAAMRVTRPGLGEWDLEAWMTWVQRRTGSDGPGYLAIVGSGPNALVLHYGDCTRSLAAGDMLLIDYAPEYDHYVADITRSWPVDGKFTPRMAELYDAVLAAQEAGIAAVAPGKTMADIDRVCRGVLAERGLGKLLPHGCCHYIGMEVHDVGDQRKPLVPGVAFTVEPGVYEKASGIGIRIEDVVVVTATGCEVLSRSVPKDRKTVIELVGTVPLPDPTRADPREKPSEPREQASGSR
jgi:Xaa-Pro aminopeptidase